MKVRNLLIIILALFSVVSVLFFSIFTSVSISNSASAQYAALTQEISLRQAENLDNYFASITREVKGISLNSTLSSYTNEIASGTAVNEAADYTRASSFLASYCSDDGDASKIVIYDTDGKIVMSNDISEIGNTLDLTAVGKYETGKVYINNDEAESSADYHLAVVNIVGKYKLIAFIKSDAIKEIFSKASFPTNGKLLMFDSNLLTLDSSSFLGDLHVEKINELEFYKTKLLDGYDGKSPIKYVIAQNTRLAYLNRVGETGWIIASVAETDKAFAYSSSASGAVTACAVFLVIIFLAADVVIVLFLTKPLKTIEETLIKVRRGDHEARIDVMTNNEYGEIARAFNDLIDDIIVSEARYRTIVEMSDNIIFEWNFKSNEVFFSNNFNKKFSYRAPSDHFGDSFLLKCKVHPDDAERYREDLEKLSKGEEFKHNEYRWKNIYSDYIWVLMRTSTIHDNEGNILKVVGVIVDIDRAKKSEKMLTTRASFDSLTGLYNRETIESAISNEIELITARKNEFAILFLDIDDFKVFNDKYSHATGDQVLQYTANVIQREIEDYGMAGRYGGDEFVICVRNSDSNDPARIAKRLLDILNEGFEYDSGEKLNIEVSIGIKIVRDTSKRVDEIIGEADDAMYKIKKNGKFAYGYLD